MRWIAGRVLKPGVFSALLLALPASAVAQGTSVRFDGRVQWISGTVLSLTRADGPAVAIDLRRIPQADYTGLAQGEWVIVEGELSPDRRRVIATGIARAPGSAEGLASPR